MNAKLVIFLLLCCSSVVAQVKNVAKTSLQTAASWHPELDLRTDVAVIYYTQDYASKISQWRTKGYVVHFMMGVSHGDYKEYFDGRYDGVTHWDEAQTDSLGNIIWYNEKDSLPYVVPTPNYANYLKTIVTKAISLGVDAIHFEEPEFWARAGYSKQFMKEWQLNSGTKWISPETSPSIAYLMNKLKYRLYFEMLEELIDYAKSYAQSMSHSIECYVPTHSIINYSASKIVSPEVRVSSIKGCDGYIGQVLAGTTGQPVFYNGIQKRRVFENAFIEYASLFGLAAPQNKKLYFLSDPMDNAPDAWSNYEKGYRSTFAAQMLYPEVNNFQVMLWPENVFQVNQETASQRDWGGSKINEEYATQVQILNNTLNLIPKGDTCSGSHGVGVLVANSMMFQTYPDFDNYSDPRLSNFYGLTLPLVKRGIPISIIHMNHLELKNTLKDIEVLIMSYSDMKPMEAKYNSILAKWIKDGGSLIYCGTDNDPFQQVKEWWNSDGRSYKSPADQLFALMGLWNAHEGVYNVGKGTLRIIRTDPKHFVMAPYGDIQYISSVMRDYIEQTGMPIDVRNYFTVDRGNYKVVAVMDESENMPKNSFVIDSLCIDLFNPELPICRQKVVNPGEQAFVYVLKDVYETNVPRVLCGGARISHETFDADDWILTYLAKGPDKTMNSERIYVPFPPYKLTLKTINGEVVDFSHTYDVVSKTLHLKYPNKSEGVLVNIAF